MRFDYLHFFTEHLALTIVSQRTPEEDNKNIQAANTSKKKANFMSARNFIQIYIFFLMY